MHADCDALSRVLAHLVTAGVLIRTETGEFELTSRGEHLRDDDPQGLRPWLDLEGAIGRADLSFVRLLHTVRTGEAAFPQQFGRRAHPHLHGTVVDLPGPAARAVEGIAAAGLEHRAHARAVSFFEPLPSGAGGYVLSGVLHDWDDPHAARILERCAEAVAPTGRVLLVDHIDATRGGIPDTEGDLRMLCYVNGRERTLEQLTELAAPTGLRLGEVVPAGTRSIVEFRPNP